MSTLRVDNVTDLGDDPVVTAGVVAGGALPAGSILQVVSVSKTDTFSASVSAGGSVDVTGLSITHTLQNASNKLFFTAFFGKAAISVASRRAAVGIAIADDGTLINIGDAAGSRVRTTAGGITSTDASGGEGEVTSMPHISYLYAPGDTNSHTYTLRAISFRDDTQTVYINRASSDSDDAIIPRSVSALTLMEVAG